MGVRHARLQMREAMGLVIRQPDFERRQWKQLAAEAMEGSHRILRLVRPVADSPLSGLPIERAYALPRYELQEAGRLTTAVLSVLPSQSRSRRRPRCGRAEPGLRALSSVEGNRHGSSAPALVHGLAVGDDGMGPERHRLQAMLANGEPGQSLTRPEGGQVMFDSLETTGLEARQEPT